MYGKTVDVVEYNEHLGLVVSTTKAQKNIDLKVQKRQSATL